MVASLCEEVEGRLLKTAFGQCYTESIRCFGHERIQLGAGVLPVNGGEATQICALDNCRGFSPHPQRDFRAWPPYLADGLSLKGIWPDGVQESGLRQGPADHGQVLRAH